MSSLSSPVSVLWLGIFAADNSRESAKARSTASLVPSGGGLWDRSVSRGVSPLADSPPSRSDVRADCRRRSSLCGRTMSEDHSLIGRPLESSGEVERGVSRAIMN